MSWSTWSSHNRTKFHIIRIRTYAYHLQLKPFDTAVALKYNQGHWKLYEWAKINEYYHHKKFDDNHIYSVRENRNVKVFATYGHSAGRPNADLNFFMWVKNRNGIWEKLKLKACQLSL